MRYLDTLELLFDGIVGSEEELAVLVKDPAGVSWQEAKYESGLRSRLDHSYDHFLEILKHMVGTLEELAAKLKIDPSGNVKSPGKNVGKLRKLTTFDVDHMGPTLFYRT